MTIKEVMENELNDLIQKTPLVLVDYSAVWCGPCGIQHDILEKIAPNVKDKVVIVSVDIDKNESLARKLRIHAVPTLQFFKNGKKVVFKTDEGDMDRFVGVQAPETLEEVINKLVKATE
ncbi:MAG: thioredoxin family protein [Candidatus Helarchaeota archaeon]|nr:thioredoxin family protein [Candidatus Helarchaeota archaeon]